MRVEIRLHDELLLEGNPVKWNFSLAVFVKVENDHKNGLRTGPTDLLSFQSTSGRAST